MKTGEDWLATQSGSAYTTAASTISTNYADGLTAINNPSSPVNTVAALTDKLYIALKTGWLIGHNSSTSGASNTTNVNNVVTEWNAILAVSDANQKTFGISEMRTEIDAFGEANGALTQTLNVAGYCKNTSNSLSIYKDYRAMKWLERNLGSSSNAKTAVKSAADTLIAAGDPANIELTGASILYYLIKKDTTNGGSNNAKLVTLADEYKECVQKLYNTGSAAVLKSRVNTCNKALLYLTVNNPTAALGIGGAYTTANMADAADNAFKVMKMMRILSTTADGTGTSETLNGTSGKTVFDFALLLVGMSYFYNEGDSNAVTSNPYR